MPKCNGWFSISIDSTVFVVEWDDTHLSNMTQTHLCRFSVKSPRSLDTMVK